jgi:lysophospholipase L1-like esterase/multidrug transporter EmrE-like cation transporter
MREDRASPSVRIISLLVVTIGIASLISSILIHPSVSRYWRADILNYQDVSLQYAVWSAVLGVVVLTVGFTFFKVNSSRMGHVVTLFTTLSIIVLSDRLLLATYGLPLWIPDAENHYVHRPNVIRSWGKEFEDKLIRINSYGHHDDEFPIKKGKGEFRGIILGDSIAMGHGVTSDETFANQLERQLLKASGRKYDHYQIINAGVQGYSTFQEFHVLERSLIFEPDFIAVGFCMNDVTEPFVVNREFGGLGIDYHGVMQTSNFAARYLINETGYGRLIQKRRSQSMSNELRQLWDLHGSKYMASHPRDDRQTVAGWNMVLSYLRQIHEMAMSNHIDFVLLVFPDTYQLMDKEYQVPHQILRDYAEQAGVAIIDFTPIFEDLIFEQPIVNFLKERGFSFAEIQALHENRIRKYFLDRDHYTPDGHKIVASKLYNYVQRLIARRAEAS